MDERRKNRRMELESTLIMRRLNSENEPDTISIEVTDVSKGGIGFTCLQSLQIGAMYEAQLVIWTKEVIRVFIEIIRMEKLDDMFSYGAIFIGMSEFDAARIQVYDTVSSNLSK